MNLKKRNAEGRRLSLGQLVVPICLALIVLLSAKLQAQEANKPSPMKISPDQAVELALKNNLSLESSRTSLETKRRASNLSWNQFIPNITVTGSLSRDNEQGKAPSEGRYFIPPGVTGTDLPVEGFSGKLYLPGTFGLFINDEFDLPQWHVVGNIQATLNLSAAMFENINRLRLDYETGLLSYGKAKLQLERDVRKAYHNILLLRENIQLMRGSFANVERQVQMAQANYNAGLAPELTLLQARVARENMRPVMDQIENGYKLSMAQFAMFLGMEYDTQYELIPISNNIGTVSGEFISLDIDEMISKAAKNKPDIQELRHTILMLRSARNAQVLSLTPALNLSWNSTSAFIKDPFKDDWFKNDKDWRNSGSLSVTFALRLHSLIPWSSDFQGINNLDDQLRSLNINLTQLIVGTEIEIYNIILSLERTRTNARAQSETVRLAEQSYTLTERAYRAGLQDYFQVQNAQQSLNQARVQLLEQQFNYLNSLIDLEYAIGVPFGTLSSKENK